MQKKLYIVFLALIATVPPLATDMYLPAIPRIATEWAIEKSVVNLSLVLWFAAYAISLLLWGSVSDRFGRRPILLSGLIGFVISSVLCAFSGNPFQLISSRIFQGIFAAGSSSMVMAIARDRFEGKQRQLVFAWIGIILGVMPMIAPSIGAAILKYAEWQFIFATQALLALVSLFTALIVYKETAQSLDRGGIGSMIRRYGRLLNNKNYILTNGTTGLLTAPFFGFIAFSATAYIVHFGMSEQRFALLFAANAICAIIGSFACTKLIKHQNEYRLLTLDYLGCLVGGVVLLFMGGFNWLIFAIGMGIFSFFFGMSRPLINHLVLEQVKQDIGTASSGVVCYQFIAGAFGMTIATREWTMPFTAFGVMASLCPLIILMIWAPLSKRIRRCAEDSNMSAECLESGLEEISGG